MKTLSTSWASRAAFLDPSFPVADLSHLLLWASQLYSQCSQRVHKGVLCVTCHQRFLLPPTNKRVSSHSRRRWLCYYHCTGMARSASSLPDGDISFGMNQEEMHHLKEASWISSWKKLGFFFPHHCFILPWLTSIFLFPTPNDSPILVPLNYIHILSYHRTPFSPLVVPFPPPLLPSPEALSAPTPSGERFAPYLIWIPPSFHGRWITQSNGILKTPQRR